ncbi:MAG TPA: hypothetical protein ENN80_09360, partial [Candidatus Hydrogenedentes bacterium]|nr:hypothetical protein [Candidatus Hydrogenedentota bacterium]
MMSRKRILKVGIVGLAHLHPRAYMPLFDAVRATKPVAVVEENATLRAAFCNDFGLRGYASLDA